MPDTNQPTRSPLRFAVIGGDLRMTHLCERLRQEGFPVRALGCGQECLSDAETPTRPSDAPPLRICSTLQSAAEGVDVLILPLPATRDGETVWCPRDPARIVRLEEIASLTRQDPRLLLFGGKLPEGFAERASDPTRVTDFYHSELLQLRNAYVTAEAALMTAMEHTDTTLRGASAAVLGYGRIGKYLARLLRALGAEVTVCARREESLFEAAAEGCHPLLITETDPERGLSPLCRGHAILFNTIPAQILSRELLLGLEPDTLLMDLASAPFGVSDRDAREAAAKIGLRYLRAPSLPGSYAPREAGYIIAECILDTLARRDEAAEAREKGGGSP